MSRSPHALLRDLLAENKKAIYVTISEPWAVALLDEFEKLKKNKEAGA